MSARTRQSDRDNEQMHSACRRFADATAYVKQGRVDHAVKMLEAAEKYTEGLRPALQVKVTTTETARAARQVVAAALAKLEAAKAPAAPAPTTVGALRRLIVGLPDSTPIGEIPGATPEWIAAVAAMLSLTPPVKEPQAAGPSGRPFRYYESAEALGL